MKALVTFNNNTDDILSKSIKTHLNKLNGITCLRKLSATSKAILVNKHCIFPCETLSHTRFILVNMRNRNVIQMEE